MRSDLRGVLACPTPKAAAIASRVTSSGVPPRPPGDDRRSTSRRLLAHERRDPVDLVWDRSDQPHLDADAARAARASQEPFVFATSPETSSFPIVTIAALGTSGEYRSVE